MIGIIDYGLGNITAFEKMLYSQNIPCQIISSKEHFKNVEKVILPGVGSFDDAILKLNNSGLREELDNHVLIKKKMILGVCIAMHLFCNRSEEGALDGLGYIDADVKHYGKDFQLPHMGWNSISDSVNHKVFKNIDCMKGFYFLHSYVAETNSNNYITCNSNYGKEFISGIIHENIFGFQFHPEKSHKNGSLLLRNFSHLEC